MPPVNVWHVERNVGTCNWRPQPTPAPASSPAAVKGCGRRGGCRGLESGVNLVFSCEKGNPEFARNHPLPLKPVLESLTTGPGR